MLASFARLGGAAVLGLSFSAPVAAQAIGTYSKAAPYEDVKFELSDAIIRRGLVVDHTGQIGTMLERTGALATASRCWRVAVKLRRKRLLTSMRFSTES